MIWDAAMPPYTDIIAEDFASWSIYMTLDLYASFNQQQLHPNSRDMTTFDTPTGGRGGLTWQANWEFVKSF